MATEAEIQRGIVRFLRDIGGAVWVTSQGYRSDPGGTRMTPGLPDLLVMFEAHIDEVAGRVVPRRLVSRWTFAEVKTPKGRLSPAQVTFRDESAKAGIPWELWRSTEDATRWARTVGIVE